MRRAAGALMLIVLMVAATPAVAQVTRADVERARERLREVAASLEEEAARFEEAQQADEALREKLDQMIVDLAVREQQLAEAKAAARERIADMYMAGTDPTDLLGAFDADSFNELPTRVGYLESLAEADRTVVNRLAAVRAAFLDEQAALEDALAEQEVVRARLEEVAASISEELAAADAEYQAIRAQWERQEEERRRREEEARRRAAEEARAGSQRRALRRPRRRPTPATTAPPPPRRRATTPLRPLRPRLRTPPRPPPLSRRLRRPRRDWPARSTAPPRSQTPGVPLAPGAAATRVST